MHRALIAASLLLAACGQPAANQSAPAPAASADPNEAHMQSLGEAQRRATLFRAIYDANLPCQQVVESAARGRVQGRLVWVARCENRAQYVVALMPGGTFQVTTVPAPAAS